MARRLLCFVAANETNYVSDEEWEEILKLQHWYSSEFFWTAGKPALKMFAVFPNLDHPLADENELMEYISKRWHDLRSTGMTENAIIRKLHNEKLILIKEGGYHDGCLLSGSVRVANNEWNAYLFTEFILKASIIAKRAAFELHDEGEFIQWRPVMIQNGTVHINVKSRQQYRRAEQIVGENELFALIDPHEFDDHPDYRTQVYGFRRMERQEKRDLLKYWNWHGYDSDVHHPEKREMIYDLNKKVREIRISMS